MVCSTETDSYPCRKLVCSEIPAAQSLLLIPGLLTPGHHVGCCFPFLPATGWLAPSRCGAVERWSSWLGHWHVCSLGLHSWFWWCWFLVSWHRGAKEGHASLYQQQHPFQTPSAACESAPRSVAALCPQLPKGFSCGYAESPGDVVWEWLVVLARSGDYIT